MKISVLTKGCSILIPDDLPSGFTVLVVQRLVEHSVEAKTFRKVILL